MKARTLRTRERYGRWALVAGGSEGLGASFARALAGEGHDLLLVAERAEPLESFAQEISREFSVRAEAIVCDLSDRGALDDLIVRTQSLELGVLVCNAAYVPFGPFVETSREDKLRALAVNCEAPLLLVDAIAPKMASRNKGAIVIVSSMAGRQGSALFATYAATKAFDLVLAESLWDELRAHGIDVVGVCAGATRTPGWERSGAEPPWYAPPVTEPDLVAREALGALGERPSLVAGVINRAATFAMERLLPRKLAIEVLGNSTRRVFRKRIA
ncbi:MAG: SDR family NAD(P)-dependent oxidoreductase [Myxococcales bacterium]|nr:SDR family NAD(P)-dependent oxidoreductase [Myxococcales bacterium]